MSKKLFKITYKFYGCIWLNKIVKLKIYLLCILPRPRLIQTRHHYLLKHFEVKQIEAVCRRCYSKLVFLKILQIS